MKTLLNLINDIRTCIAKLQASSLNGFKKGKHLAKLTARLRKLYKQVAAKAVKHPAMAGISQEDALNWLITDNYNISYLSSDFVIDCAIYAGTI